MKENEIKKNILVIVIIFILAHMGVAIVNGGFSGVLQDTDAYMWLNRVTYLHENGNWFDHNYPRVNPPFGHEQHWIRPFDFFLLVGASILSPLLGFEKALLVCSLFISPILGIAALLSFFWALYPFLDLKSAPKKSWPFRGFCLYHKWQFYLHLCGGAPIIKVLFFYFLYLLLVLLLDFY